MEFEQLNDPFATLSVPYDVSYEQLLARKPIYTSKEQKQAYDMLCEYGKADRLDLLAENIALDERLNNVLAVISDSAEAEKLLESLDIPYHEGLLEGTKEDVKNILSDHRDWVDELETKYEQFVNARNLNVALTGGDSKFHHHAMVTNWSEEPGRAAKRSFLHHFMGVDGESDALIDNMEARNTRLLADRAAPLARNGDYPTFLDRVLKKSGAKNTPLTKS